MHILRASTWPQGTTSSHLRTNASLACSLPAVFLSAGNISVSVLHNNGSGDEEDTEHHSLMSAICHLASYLYLQTGCTWGVMLYNDFTTETGLWHVQLFS